MAKATTKNGEKDQLNLPAITSSYLNIDGVKNY